MRVGMNPNRTSQADKYLPVALAVVTYLPNMQGYHAKRLEIIKLCLESMRKFAGVEHTFIVWDSGSCGELVDWLEYEFKPDIFIKSNINIGKNSSRSSIVRMLPPETIVACSDDDILYYPDWLRQQIELLEHFPNVSAVTGYPVRTSFRWGNEKTMKWAKKNADIKRGKFLPEEWERDFAVSIGRDPDAHMSATETELDTVITYNGKSAYATSHHCQFIGRAGTVAKASIFDGMAMGDEKPFDIAMDNIGLRLATMQRLARHMGNVIDDRLREEITRLKI